LIFLNYIGDWNAVFCWSVFLIGEWKWDFDQRLQTKPLLLFFSFFLIIFDLTILIFFLWDELRFVYHHSFLFDLKIVYVVV
jgi:hypothetical protein